MSLNSNDYGILDKHRLERYRHKFQKLLSNSTLALNAYSNGLWIIKQDANVQPLMRHIVELRWQAWLVVGAGWLTIATPQGEVYTSQSRPQTVSVCNLHGEKWHKLENNVLSGSLSMATVTLESTTASTATIPDIPAVPALEDLNALAAQYGLNPDFAAAKIHEMGGTIFRDVDIYKVAIDGWNSFLGWYRGFIGGEMDAPAAQTNGATAVTADATDAEVKPRAARFKTFVKPRAKSLTKVIGAFLDAQGWSDEQRMEAYESIAGLPVEQADATTWGEKCLAKILSVYTKAERPERVDMINATRKYLGQPALKP